MPDRRQHPRLPCELDVMVEGLDRAVSLTTRDVSHGGVFLFSRQPRPLNASVEVTLQAGQARLRARGTVVHHLPDVGFGIQFTEMAAVDLGKLEVFLAEVEASAAASAEASREASFQDTDDLAAAG